MTVIEMVEADANSRSYGIMYDSAQLHKVTGARHNPHGRFLISVWNNVDRPNPHPGEVRWTDHGSRGGEGRYLDPHGRGTDNHVSVTMNAQASVISLHRDPNARREGQTLRVGGTVSLRLPDGGIMGPYLIAQKPLHDPHLTEV